MLRYRIYLSTLVFAGTLVAAPGSARVYEGWDRDGDGNVSAEEFRGPFGDIGTYSGRDLNGDGVVGLDEFVADKGPLGAYESWDFNDDGSLSEDEYTDGVFDSYDADGSGGLDDRELEGFGRDFAPDGPLSD